MAAMQAYAAAGVQRMYPWQAAALQCGWDGCNLVYVAPTSGGKSLVAEVLLVRRLVASQHPVPSRPDQKVSRCSTGQWCTTTATHGVSWRR